MGDEVLIIGYGNPDREDDGVAWHILKSLATRLGQPEPSLDLDSLQHHGETSDLLCMLQLDPDVAEVITNYDRVCFVDAHTGAYQEEIRFERIEGEFQSSPFTHHMTPQTCLILAETLFGQAPQAIVVSVRGYQFGFSHELSIETATLAEAATDRIFAWLSSDSSNGG